MNFIITISNKNLRKGYHVYPVALLLLAHNNTDRETEKNFEISKNPSYSGRRLPNKAEDLLMQDLFIVTEKWPTGLDCYSVTVEL